MKFPLYFSFNDLQEKISRCTRCPRLVEYRESVPSSDEKCWRRPVSGFGDAAARLLIIGLAPSSQGGNRTGRIFTGDLSGKFLMNALYQTGFANKQESLSKEDGLVLTGCYLTAAVKCVPPKHKPLRQEFQNCSGYLDNEIFLLKELRAVLTLGGEALHAYFNFLKQAGGFGPPFPKFAHGLTLLFKGWPTLYTSYHPTPQNTNTGRLTEAMFVSVLKRISEDIKIA